MTTLAVDVVVCAAPHCSGVILTRDYDGQWAMKHHGRKIKFSFTAPIIVTVDCNWHHATVVKIDGERVETLTR